MISGGSKSMQALLSGGLDFAHVSGGVSVQASLSGADVVIIGTGSNSMSAGVIAVKEIKSYQDLKAESVLPASAATTTSATASRSTRTASTRIKT